MANINFKNICKLVEAATKEETQDKIANSFVAASTNLQIFLKLIFAIY